MNCQNCGAPLVAKRGRTPFWCEHCETYQFAGADESVDGLTPLGESSGRQCPCCATDLYSAAIAQVHVEHCGQCRGVLVSSEDFPFLLQQLELPDEGPLDVPQPLDPAELTRRVGCPTCDGQMEVHPYHGRGNAVIDSCHRCRVIWFDHGEIGTIRRSARR